MRLMTVSLNGVRDGAEAPVTLTMAISPKLALLELGLFVALAVCLVAAFGASEVVGGAALKKLAVPMRMGSLVLVSWVLLRRRRLNWRALGLTTPTNWGRTAALVAIGYGAVVAAAVVMTQMVLPALGLPLETAQKFANLRGNPTEWLVWMGIVWTSAAFGEELVFRGYLQNRLENASGHAGIALVAQAMIFGALHLYQGVGGAFVAGATGLVLGAVYLAGKRNLWAPILLHGIVDSVSLTAIYLGAAG